MYPWVVLQKLSPSPPPIQVEDSNCVPNTGTQKPNLRQTRSLMIKIPEISPCSLITTKQRKVMYPASHMLLFSDPGNTSCPCFWLGPTIKAVPPFPPAVSLCRLCCLAGRERTSVWFSNNQNLWSIARWPQAREPTWTGSGCVNRWRVVLVEFRVGPLPRGIWCYLQGQDWVEMKDTCCQPKSWLSLPLKLNEKYIDRDWRK